ncbi:hypothetical protein ACIQPR_47520 [Streptomyces sp. NPDC091280]|uniref:hypothetical protein n=1 Tax=Streptomyces sp. NPDC091280 TaxID=3365984 RepID=UPI0037F9D103
MGSHSEDELALEVTAVEQPVRVDDALEQERLLYGDPEPALFDELGETSQGNRIGVARDTAEAQANRLAPGDDLRQRSRQPSASPQATRTRHSHPAVEHNLPTS